MWDEGLYKFTTYLPCVQAATMDVNSRDSLSQITQFKTFGHTKWKKLTRTMTREMDGLVVPEKD